VFMRKLGCRFGRHRGIGDFVSARLSVSLLLLFCNAVLLPIKLERLSVLYQVMLKFNNSFSEKLSKAYEIHMFISSHLFFVVSLALAVHTSILMANNF
jgi:hypothetical protein